MNDIKVNADLLDQMATANEQTAEFIEGGNMQRMTGVQLALPPEMIASMLRGTAAAQRKLAKNTREGLPIRERISTDG